MNLSVVINADMISDQEMDWIKSSQKGDLIAFGKLAEKYQDMIFNLSLRMLKNRQDAEDLCQDVLVKIFKTIGQFSANASFAGWIYRITYNESINKIRKLKRIRESLDIDSNERENWSDTVNVLDQYEKDDRRNIILNAIDELPRIDRFLIMSYYFEELPIKEISEITDLSVSNIKIKLYRSRKALHKILSNPALKENLI